MHLPALPVGLISVQVLPLDIGLALDDKVVHTAATTCIPYLVLFFNLLNCEILSELLEVPSHVWHLREVIDGYGVRDLHQQGYPFVVLAKL